jgi:2-oxoglutarate dehydrogenase E2 component (dihydrolipoamide succinyltransferase)
MSEKILVPVLGESITEATVSKWLKNKGETVDADEPIVELETDKVNLEVPSPVTGKLIEINSQDGSTVKVGEILGLVTEIEGEVKRSNKIEKIQPSNLQKKEEIKEKDNVIKLDPIKEQAELDIFEEENNGNELKEEPLVLTEEIKNSHTENNSSEESQTLSPAVRKMVDENNIDVKSVKGSGKDGRILKGDLISLMGVNPPPSERKIKYGQEERIKMTRLRQTIAKRLKQAQENAALLTTFNEVDMTNIINMRKDNQEDFQSRYGIKLGFMSFFVKACIVALKNFPAVNAEIDGDTIVYKNYYNISFAVGTDKGLVVPVLKNADELSFADIEKNIKEISEKAKDGKLVIEDLQGGTFTISNGGVYGSMLSTPILNLPQSGVLGMHNIVDRPIVVDGEIKIRPVMYLALSYDHRIIDGKESVSFLKMIKESLEDPRRLFLDI